MFLGIAFLLISLALSRSIGAGWWFWLMIPAFSMMGTGIAQFIRLRERDKRTLFNAPPSVEGQVVSSPPRALPQRNTGELVPSPPSVTEGTTRHLGVGASTRHFDGSPDQK